MKLNEFIVNEEVKNLPYVNLSGLWYYGEKDYLNNPTVKLGYVLGDYKSASVLFDTSKPEHKLVKEGNKFLNCYGINKATKDEIWKYALENNFVTSGKRATDKLNSYVGIEVKSDLLFDMISCVYADEILEYDGIAIDITKDKSKKFGVSILNPRLVGYYDTWVYIVFKDRIKTFHEIKRDSK